MNGPELSVCLCAHSATGVPNTHGRMSGRRVGFWFSDKKRRRMNLDAFVQFCIDLTQPLGPQGPFDIIIHKLSDVIVEAEHNMTLLSFSLQSYVSAHPDTILLDPLPAMTQLLDRFASCQKMSQLNSSLRGDLQLHICKTRVAHGSYSHEMCLLFSAASLADIHPPCVLQSFVNHGAVLYKVYVVGDKHCCVERPSIKNFPSGPCDRKTIFFNSHQVSKPESNSDLTSLDEQMLGLALFGVDVIVNISTHTLTVIDINIFPGYEGMPQFFSSLLSHIQSVLDQHASAGSS
uniref:Inositol-tetrakisphosphate 1-kinase n=1 Tax=Amphilophus citrinellus TaxID=61819 RepID=A0A3Q0QZL1_AMPCI